MPPRCSVVIAVRNDEAGIRATLEALAGQTMSASAFEVVVVDDASTDRTGDVAETYENVTVVRSALPGGSYVARNRGLAETGGEIIAITDADCRPAPDWLEKGVARVEREGSVVVAGHIAMPLSSRPSLAAMVDVVHHLDQERYVEERGHAVTANILAPKSVFDEVGGFNEELRSSGDVEWTTRARVAGHRLVYAREVVVIHPPRVTAGALLRKSRRVAEGGSSLRRQRTTSRERPPYLQKGVIVPRHRQRGRVRLAENGVTPGPLRWLAVGVAQVVLLQVPQALYALRADLRAAVRARRLS